MYFRTHEEAGWNNDEEETEGIVGDTDEGMAGRYSNMTKIGIYDSLRFVFGQPKKNNEKQSV